MAAPGTAGYVFPIGKRGTPWGVEERKEWLGYVGAPRRLYATHVIEKLEALKQHFDVEQYGSLDYSGIVEGGFGGRYPLMCVKSRGWSAAKPTVLITGGVHGYETSGVQGVLQFCRERMASFAGLNILVVPCVSPWGYEHVQRWTCAALDPNRGFFEGTLVEEAAALQRLIASVGGGERFLVHIDCHETTNTDETLVYARASAPKYVPKTRATKPPETPTPPPSTSEFTPAKHARDGTVYTPEAIPDGFYLVGDCAYFRAHSKYAERPRPLFTPPAGVLRPSPPHPPPPHTHSHQPAARMAQGHD
jgi:hypothetical protein